DFLCRFTLRSDFGTFDVHGLRMLHIRVREVHGLAQLNQMSNTQEFLQAAAQAVARPVTSAVNMIFNPVETVEGLPGGVTRLFDRIKLGGVEIAAAATAPSGTDEQKVASITQRVGSITVELLGFEKDRRQLAKSVGVDPYTTNPVLAKKLTDMAWVAFSGRVAIEAAVSAVVPDSTIMSAVSFTNSTIYDTPPGDLVNNAQSIFAATGASPGHVQGLLRAQQYLLSVLTAGKLSAGALGCCPSPPRRRRRTRRTSWPRRSACWPATTRARSGSRWGRRRGPSWGGRGEQN